MELEFVLTLHEDVNLDWDAFNRFSQYSSGSIQTLLLKSTIVVSDSQPMMHIIWTILDSEYNIQHMIIKMASYNLKAISHIL